jgi:RNA methyltransferase, TrmH family
MDIITSNQNSHVKEVKSLKQKKNRDELKLYFIEGERFLEEAVKERANIEKIMVSESYFKNPSQRNLLKEIESLRYEIFLVTDKLFNEISDTENPQGILAIVRMMEYDLERIYNNNSFIIILDSIQDPGNLGTIIRTADAAGASGIIYSKGCVDLYNPKVLRGTMGSVFHLPIIYSDNLSETINILKEKNIKIYAAHLSAKVNYFDVDMQNQAAIIIGNEANGISDEIAKLSDTFIKIPMPGKSESLNASVAASLLMYEVVRQRMK